MSNTNTITRRSRRTGATITARRDDFLGWITVCETHGAFCEHKSRTAALEWMPASQVWCGQCAEVV